MLRYFWQQHSSLHRLTMGWHRCGIAGSVCVGESGRAAAGEGREGGGGERCSLTEPPQVPQNGSSPIHSLQQGSIHDFLLMRPQKLQLSFLDLI